MGEMKDDEKIRVKSASARATTGNILRKARRFPLFERMQRRRLLFFCRKNVRRSAAGASLTVEAAWVVPLFFLCVVSLICMMDLFGAYSDAQMRLGQEAERIAAVQGAEEPAGDRYVDLIEPVVYRVQWFPVPIPAVSIPCRGRVRVWSGDAGSPDQAGDSGSSERLVLVTEHESVYHTHADCTHIALSVEAVSKGSLSSLRNAEGRRYHACEKCAGNGAANAVVYVAADGTCYHNDAHCSGLVRKVRLVPESEVAGLRECSRCAAREKKNGE
uniref:hypothetical protein n=1 Tax=Eubacterium cellulosolvens TaxID=29322 RepID=UPI000482F202|nr:hypothetical protein [[Eubacterium] cellulosolvens]